MNQTNPQQQRNGGQNNNNNMNNSYNNNNNNSFNQQLHESAFSSQAVMPISALTPNCPSWKIRAKIETKAPVREWDKGDKHFSNLWNLIDTSKDFICFSMYHFDDTYTAKITLHKLTEAARRGVNVVLMHDILVSKVDED